MSNRLRRIQRYQEQKKLMHPVLVHGFMWYSCKTCGNKFKMYLEKGIEEGGEDHKPSPFVIRCRCGGSASDTSGIIKLSRYMHIADNMSYFANKHDSDCGVPILR